MDNTFDLGGKVMINRSMKTWHILITMVMMTAVLHSSYALAQDLVVTEVSWTPVQTVIGSNVRFNITIQNQGTTSTPDGVIHGVGIYIDDEIACWTDTYSTSIPAGGSVTLDTDGGPGSGDGTWVPPSSGTYSVNAFVDDVNRMWETNENNNQYITPLTVTEAWPDLVITNLSWTPAEATIGNPVQFHVTVLNQGTTATPDGVISGVGINIGGETVCWTDTYTTPTPAGDSVTLNTDSGPGGGDGTWTPTSTGNHLIDAYVDDIDRIEELDENNNVLVTSIDVTSSSNLPEPWANGDVGNVGSVGSVMHELGTFTVNGSGEDIWNNQDGFHFVHQSLQGDGEIIARVTDVEYTDDWAKAGVMIRESLDDNSKHVMTVLTPHSEICFQRRTQNGGGSNHTGVMASIPYWVKVTRTGNTFTGYMSGSGTEWTLIDSVTIDMADDVYMGLAVTAHNNSTLCTAVFDNVSTSGSTQGEPVPIDLSQAVVMHNGSNPHCGFPDLLYDGDENTAGLCNYADEPVDLTFIFLDEVEIVGARAYFSDAWGDPAYQWDFDVAQSLDDLNTRSGSYQLLGDDLQSPSHVWSELACDPTPCSYARLSGVRLTGDHYFHIREVEILVTPDSAFVQKLDDPRGIALDQAGRRVIADAGKGAIVVLDSNGDLVDTLGEMALSSPQSVSVEASGNYIVADTGRDQVLRLSATTGQILSILADTGSGVGQVNNPTGVDVDSAGRILVADQGNHRVMRLNSGGGVDTSFGQGGQVGVTGQSGNDDSHFNGPTGVTCDQAGSRVLVADRGNHRIQVLDSNGSYLRTVDAVYLVNAVAIDDSGTMFATGDGITHEDKSGSIRVIDPDAEFVSGHIWNGNAEVGLLTSGIALAGDGTIIACDATKGRLLQFDSQYTPELYGVDCSTTSDSMTLTYKTSESCSTRILWQQGSQMNYDESSEPVTDHTITIDNLAPQTRCTAQIIYPSSMDNAFNTYCVEPFTTTAEQANSIDVMQLNTIGVIYTAGCSAEVIQLLHDHLDIVEEFYYRNTRGRLHLNIEHVEIDRMYTENDVTSYGLFKSSSVQSDLAQLGYGPESRIDEVMVFFTGLTLPVRGLRGGTADLFGRTIGYASMGFYSPQIIIHEVNHTIDFMYINCGIDDYPYNHGIWAVDSELLGYDGVVNAGIARSMPDCRLLAMRDPFPTAQVFVDMDMDGVADYGDLPVTESTLGSNPNLADTDGDGVSDLRELTASSFESTNPTLADTDGDAATQGNDLYDKNPLLDVNGYIAKTSTAPVIDGVINTNEGWRLVSDQYSFTNRFIHHLGSAVDTNDHDDTSVWMAWDDDAIYFAVRLSYGAAELRVDANGDGWFKGYDNHRFYFTPPSYFDYINHASDKDVLHAIPGAYGNNWSEIFDTQTKWYNAPDHSTDPGLGYERLMTLSTGDHAMQYNTGDEMYHFELRIPAGNRRSMFPHAGQEVRFYLRIDDDSIYLDDQFTRALLVDEVDTDGDGLWDMQEADLAIPRYQD